MIEKRLRALIVDDLEEVRFLLGMVLDEAGFDVELAEDGESGLAQVEARRPDIVFADLKMPRLDGWGMVERLRSRPDPPPVVLVSGAADEITRGPLAPPVAGFLLKPFRPDEVVLMARRVLNPPAAGPTVEDRRAQPRRPLVVSGSVVDRSGDPIALGTITDVSLGGAQFLLDARFEVGKTVRLQFAIPGQEHPLLVEGRIRWSRNGAVGLQFTGLSPEQTALLEQIVSAGGDPPR